MEVHVLKGSREEIAEGLARIRGEVREAIVFVEPSAATSGQAGPGGDQSIAVRRWQ